MREFNGTLVIVDPKVFIKKEDLGKNVDFEKARISPKLEFKPLYFIKVGHDCMYLSYNRVMNTRDYYQNGAERYTRETVNNAFNGNVKPSQTTISIESGVVGIFIKDDLDKYNPEALKGLKPGVDYVIVPDYKGKIGCFRDKYGIIHFYGTGTTNFYTI